MINSIIQGFEVWTDAQGIKSKGRVKSIDNISLEGISRLREFIYTLAAEGYLVKGVKTITFTIGEIAELIMGQAPPGNQCNAEGIGTAFVKTGEFGKIYPDKVEWTTKPLKLAKEGDVLICVVGATVGKLNLAINCAIGRSVAAIRPNEKVTTKYLYYCLMPYTLKLRAQSRGSAQGVIGKEELNAIKIRIPSIQKQNTIVSRLENLLALCDKLEEEKTKNLTTLHNLVKSLLETLIQAKDADELQSSWEKISQHFDTLFCTEDSIELLKETILQLAVMGKLVKQDTHNGHANELLRTINVNKEKLIKEGYLKKQLPLGKINENDIPFEVPENWRWVKLGELSLFINGDRGKNYPNVNEYVIEGVPWINTGHIEPTGFLTTSNMNYISREKFNSLRSGKIHKDDLVYCLRGATFGKTAFVEPYEEGAIASSLMIIRPHITEMRKFIFLYLHSPLSKHQLFRFDNGSAQPNLSANSVLHYVFPLPPLTEQHRIVAKVDELFRLFDALKSKLGETQELKRILSKTIVEKAN